MTLIEHASSLTGVEEDDHEHGRLVAGPRFVLSSYSKKAQERCIHCL